MNFASTSFFCTMVLTRGALASERVAGSQPDSNTANHACHHLEQQWQAGWLVNWLAARLSGWLAVWLTGSLDCWRADWLTSWLSGQLVGFRQNNETRHLCVSQEPPAHNNTCQFSRNCVHTESGAFSCVHVQNSPAPFMRAPCLRILGIACTVICPTRLPFSAIIGPEAAGCKSAGAVRKKRPENQQDLSPPPHE